MTIINRNLKKGFPSSKRTFSKSIKPSNSLPVSPASSRVSSRSFVLKLRLGLRSLISQAFLIILQLHPRSAGHIEHAPDGHHGRQEDDGVEDDQTWK